MPHFITEFTCENMNVETLRDFCLSLPDVSEKMPFQAFKAAKEILAFYVGGHIFCYFDIMKFDHITIKCAQSEELIERYMAAMPPYNMSKKSWVGIAPNQDITDQHLLQLITDSYHLVAKSKRK